MIQTNAVHHSKAPNCIPVISIGLPVFNGGPLLAAAIDSLLVQTYQDFELIIVDNASTDGTAELCQDYAARDHRVRYYRNSINIGAAGNHTRTVGFAQGVLFKWAGSDDLYAPTYLERCLAVLLEKPLTILCYPQAFVINDDGAVVREYNDHFHLVGMSPPERLRRVLEHSNMELLNPSLGLIRTAALRRCMPVGRYYASDRVLLAQLAIDGEFYEHPDRLFYRRVYSRKQNWTTGSDEQVTAWFDPAAKGGVMGPRIKKMWGYWNAVTRSHQPWEVKSACYKTLLEFYGSGSRIPGALIELQTLHRTVVQKVTGNK